MTDPEKIAAELRAMMDEIRDRARILEESAYHLRDVSNGLLTQALNLESAILNEKEAKTND